MSELFTSIYILYIRALLSEQDQLLVAICWALCQDLAPNLDYHAYKMPVGLYQQMDELYSLP